MFPGSGDGNGVQNFKEIEVQHLQKVCSSAFIGLPFAPGIKGSLSITEDFVDGSAGIQLLINDICVAFVCQCNLVFQIVEAVVNRRSR